MCVSIAQLHKLRSEIIDYSNKNSFFELKRLASLGNSYAQYLLGEMYLFGEGVLINYEESVKWLCLAVDTGSPEAMFHLAQLVDPDYTFHNLNIESKRTIKSRKISTLLRKTAFDIFFERSKNNDIYVAKWLALCYATGAGVSLDIEKAREWDRKSPTNPYPV